MSNLRMITLGRTPFGFDMGLSTISCLLYGLEFTTANMRGTLMCMFGVDTTGFGVTT